MEVKTERGGIGGERRDAEGRREALNTEAQRHREK